MIYPLVTDLAADGVPVAVTCRVLGFSKQGYYRWRASPVTERDWVDAHLVNAARDIHADDPAFGYRFIADELPGMGIVAGENRVQRLCRDHGICFGDTQRNSDGSLRPTAEAISNLHEAIVLADQNGLDYFGVGEHTPWTCLRHRRVL